MSLAYFPFTYVSEVVAQKINKIFGKFYIYQPIDNLISALPESKLFDTLIPDINYRSEIKLAINESYNWLYTNCGSKKLDVKVTESTIREKSFYNDNSIEFIRYKIKNINSKEARELCEDVLFTSCFFLALAQYNDFYNHQLTLGIENFKFKERTLTDILQGHDVIRADIGKSKDFTNNIDSSAFMCPERIRAWSTIVLESKILPDFLVTNSFLTLETLMNINFGVKMLKTNPLHIVFSKNSEKLIEYLVNITTESDLSQHKIDQFEKLVDPTNSIKESRDSIQITIFILPGISIRNFLIRVSPLGLQSNTEVKIKNKIHNTTIVLIN